MKLKFLGVLKVTSTRRGCSSCGTSRLAGNSLTRITSKTYLLPNGRRIDVRAGVIIEVSRDEGLYLIDQQYKVGSTIYPEFEVV